tara:strand:- start:194 stop:511 length:318 start_codon:yes stop_codon:yes gene_type:complete
MSDICLVFMTAPDEACAVSIAQTVVTEGLAACGNLIPGIRSIYRWKNEVCDDSEVLVLFKTTHAGFAVLSERILALHPYDCPEVIALDVNDGNEAYMRWVSDQLG